MRFLHWVWLLHNYRRLCYLSYQVEPEKVALAFWCSETATSEIFTTEH